MKIFEYLNIARLYFNESCRDLEPYLLVLATICLTCIVVSIKNWLCTVSKTDESLWHRVKSNSFKLLINIPFVKGFARKKLNETVILEIIYKKLFFSNYLCSKVEFDSSRIDETVSRNDVH